MTGLELITLVHPEIADDVGDTLHYAYLPNIPGQTYTIGSTFPGEKDGEEFIFYRYRKISFVRPIHARITVDEKGRYYIANAGKSAKVFINSELITKAHVLKQGDLLCFGILQSWDDYKGGPMFRVELPDLTKHNSESREIRISNRNNPPFTPENNSLILSQILSFLPLKDVKNCRLLSRKWAVEGGKALEKRGGILFLFSAYYLRPSVSMKTFRLLNENMGLKFRKLYLFTSRLQPPEIPGNRKRDEFQFFQDPLRTCKGEPGEKMLLDFRKFLTFKETKLSKISTLNLNGWIKGSMDFNLFHKILETFGENLTELELVEDFSFIPEEIPKLNFPNLKKFSHMGQWTSTPRNPAKCQKWISYIVPLINENINTFFSAGTISSMYLETFLEIGTLNLTQISLHQFPLEDIVLLMKLNQLTSADLSFRETDPLNDNGYQEFQYEFTKTAEILVFQDFLKKQSESLKFLQVDLQVKTGMSGNIVFPKFPKLESFNFIYGENVNPKWGFGGNGNAVKYDEFLPKIRKLKVCPRPHPKYNFILTGKDLNVGKPLLEENDEVWNSFFPEDGNEIVSTLVQLKIPSLRKGGNTKAKYDRYKKRLEKIPRMFPNVWNEQLREIRQMELEV